MIEQITSLSPLLIVVVTTALLFDFVNGWNDSANAIATVVGTRVLGPIKAVTVAAITNLVGALAGTAVAKTIYKGLLYTGPGFIEGDVVVLVVLAAMLGAIVWAAWMTLIGLPISGSHSLVGGLVGAAVAAGGVRVLQGGGIGKVLIAMLISPLAGAIIAFLMLLAIYWIVKSYYPVPINRSFSVLQVISCCLMGFNHGLNDAQKVMGVITMALIAGGIQDPLTHPAPFLWVKIACAVMISLGTAIGGWKVIKTLGHHLSKLTPVDGFAAETAASIVLSLAARWGVPVSTTHTITGCIMGVGSRRGLGAVKWAVGQKIILAWVFTLPTTAALAGGIYWILSEWM